jgi:hypothetical protein
MKGIWLAGICGFCLLAALRAYGGEPSVTVYNQEFAVVRDTAQLDLKKGVNNVRYTDITAHLEPDSVMLRDPSGKRALQILEQNYRADPISEGLLLNLYEGKTIDFLIQRQDKSEIVKGKIIRSGYVPHWSAMRRYGQQYYQTQMARAYTGGPTGQPIIEVNGQLRFSMPGIPLFPSLADDTILKPTLQWVIETDQDGPLAAELCYVTGGMTWEADYNMVAPEQGDVLDLVGWVTMDNQCGKTFENVKIKLMAGDVSKIRREEVYAGARVATEEALAFRRPVTEKAFEEYHLYSLERRTTLHDRETKQVEFIRASGVQSQRFYVYDGAKIDFQRYQGYNSESIRQDRNYGTQCNPKVWVMREFVNSEANHLGLPLPKGRVRFYRRDADGQLEFTGENVIDHTPRGETVSVYIGNAFDIVGEWRRTNYRIDTARDWLDESFEIKLRNRKKEPVEIRVVEHLYRWINWEITQKSDAFEKKDSQTVEFRVPVEPDKEKVVTYSVHYTW